MESHNNYLRFNNKLFFRRLQLNDRFVGDVNLNDFGNQTVLAVNPDTYEILELLDRGLTMEECASILAERYCLDKEETQNTIGDIITPFIENGMAEFTEAVPPETRPCVPPCLELEKDFPVKAVSLELLSKCNLKCKHCYGEFDNHGTDMLSKETVFSLLDQLKDLQCIQVSFTGGEVFLHKDFLEILEYAHRYKFKLSFLTNGTLITPVIIERLKKIGHTEIQVSIDGFTADIHDYFRGIKGSFAKSINALTMLKEAGFTLAVAHVVNRTNFRTVKGMKELADGLNAFLKVGPLLRYGNGARNIDRLYVKPSEYYNVHKGIKDSGTDGKAAESVQNNKPAPNPDYIERCGAGRGKLAIKANGDVIPCEILPPSEQFLMGNIYHSSIEEIAYGFDREGRLGNFNAFNVDNCGGCAHIRECKGGCPAVSYAEYGHLDIKDPFSCARITALHGEPLQV